MNFEIAQTLGYFLGGFVISLLTAREVSRRKESRREARENAKRTVYIEELQRVERRMADLETRHQSERREWEVEIERKQQVIEELTATLGKYARIEQLYTSLNEAHQLLQKDHDELKVVVETARMEVAQLKNDHQAALAREKALQAERDQLLSENNMLKIRVEVYQDALSRVHESLAAKAQAEPPAPEPSTPDSAATEAAVSEDTKP